ncbi:MAG TPA: hypothetical protein VI386_11405 [Candidatus Sulfotelmatobacter sp.]
MPLGTTTMLNATSNGPHASNASAKDARQRSWFGAGTAPAFESAVARR